MPPHCNTVLNIDVQLTAGKIRPFLECLGLQGRSAYLAFFHFDFLLFPLVYANVAHRALTLAWPESRPLLPAAVVVFDVLENSGIVFLLLDFPLRHKGVEELVPWLLRLKWATVAAIVVSVVVGATSPRTPTRKHKLR
ncbi:hypothetical protein PybrP1_006114 [[Pythium] brassicae (nom. inval.)]|nr:hypothetical protein PybrP1_006114 [[Pythium] brassicae (nom. inval.)]